MGDKSAPTLVDENTKIACLHSHAQRTRQVCASGHNVLSTPAADPFDFQDLMGFAARIMLTRKVSSNQACCTVVFRVPA